MADAAKPFRPKRRRWPWYVGGSLAAAALAWTVAERLIDVDRYRPLITDRIQKATGLPAAIGHIDLSLLPVPSVHLQEVTVGQGDFRANCEDAVAYPRLESLGRGQFDVREVVLRGLAVTLPKETSEAKARIAALGPTEPGTGPPVGGSISVGLVRAEGARLFLGDDPNSVLTVDATVQDVLSDTIAVTAQGVVPSLGQDAQLDGKVTLSRGTDVGLGVKGNVRLSNIDTATLVKTRNIPSGVASLEAAVERTGSRTFAADIQGHATPHPLEGVDLDPLVGNFTAKAWWDDGTVTINDILWKAAAVELAGDVSLPMDGALAAKVKDIRVTEAGLNTLFAFRGDLPVRLHAASGAAFTAQDVLLGFTAEHYLRLSEGSAAFKGIDLSLKSGETAFQSIQGAATFHEGVVKVERLDTEGIALKGTVEPDFSTGITKLDLSGQVGLNRERLLTMVPAPQITEVKGRVDLSHIRGTFVPGEGMPVDLVVEGTLKNGLLVVKSDAWDDRFEPLSAEFTAAPGRIDTRITSQSAKLGATQLNGQYLLAERTWKGKASGDLTRMDLPFLQQESAQRVAPGIVGAYGPSTFDVTLDLPGPERPAVTVAFARTEAPALSGSVAWRKQGAAWALGDIQVNATIPGSTLKPLLPASAEASGDVVAAFARLADKKTFDAHIDLSPATLTLGEYFRKAPGDAAAVDVHGEASPAIWSARTVDIHALGETVHGHFEGPRFVLEGVDLDAGPLSALLARGGKATGRIRGRVATNPTEVDLTMADFGVALSPDLVLDSVNGSVAVSPESVSVNGLSVKGANSECVVTVNKRQDHWSGRVTGPQLDINGMQALMDALNAYREPEGAAEPPEAAGGGIVGEFAVGVDRLIYRQAHFTDASADVTMRNGRFRINNLHLRNEAGAIAGSIEVDPGAPIGRFAANLSVENVGAHLIDQLAFIEPRGLKGTLNGAVTLEMPAGGGVNPTDGLNGAIEFTGRDGSFGKLGIATKILAVLRVTEITRLRVPTLKDELTYDTCTGRIAMTNGLMNIQEMNIRTPSYFITVIGTIDFPAQQTELLAHADLLETVLGPGEAVPGVREIADKFRTMGGLRILVTGPPDNPETRYGWGPPVAGVITDDVRNSLRSTGDLVRDEVLNRASEALRSILK